REYGFASWTALKEHVERKALNKLSREDVLKRWLELVYGAGFTGPRPALAVQLLRERPDLIGDDPYLACAVGNEALLRKTLADRPGWVHEAGGPMRMLPLI